MGLHREKVLGSQLLIRHISDLTEGITHAAAIQSIDGRNSWINNIRGYRACRDTDGTSEWIKSCPMEYDVG